MPQPWHGRPARGVGPGIYVTDDQCHSRVGRSVLKPRYTRDG